MSVVRAGLTALLVTCGALEALAALYLLVIATAAHRRRRLTPSSSPSRRVVVLVPAHDEEMLIARCVQSLMAQDYPYHLARVVVVADNCNDATAGRAAAAGAEVLVRHQPDSRG